MACSSTDFQYTCTLSEETLAVAKKELNEDPSTRLLELKAFRDRLQAYPGLKANLDPHFLIRFLRARKFDQERAFELILNYYKMRQADPHIFTGLKPSALSLVYASQIAYPHTHRDRLGRKIYIINPCRMDTTHYTPLDCYKVEFLNTSKMIQEEETQVRGFVLLIDFQGLTMTNFLQLNIDFARRNVKLWQETFPARIKNWLFVNEPTFIDMVLALFTPFMTEKLVSRIVRLGTDWEKLHEYIDPACLPPRYGGTLEHEADPKEWEATMMASDRELEEESKFGFVDFTMGQENDRKQEDAITNMAGTFKKLDVQ